MPARTLFVVLEGHGHVTPTLPLVSELVRRRHRVDYACGPAYRDAVAAAGAHWVRLPGMAPFVPPAEVGPDVVARFFRHFFAAMAATFPVRPAAGPRLAGLDLHPPPGVLPALPRRVRRRAAGADAIVRAARP